MRSIFLTLAGVLTVCAPILVSFADDDHEGRGGPVTNQTYKAECGACHMAYSPRFLPVRSWQKLMGGLSDHFGDNAEVSPATAKEIITYLEANAADASGRARGFAAGFPADQTPLRISELPRFKRQHHEIDMQMARNNPKINSMSNCMACHTRADQGSFREREINIPGVGRWDD